MAKFCTKKAELAEEIRYELEQLRLLAAAAKELAAAAEQERRPWDAAAAAKYISDLCAGLENLWKRRCVYLDIAPPGGADSHVQTLKDFLATPGLGKRLAPDMPLRLKRYLDFRHRFIHGYGFQVSWKMVAEPLRLLPETVDSLAEVWIAWLDGLPD